MNIHMFKKTIHVLWPRKILELMSSVCFRLSHLLPIHAESFQHVGSPLCGKYDIQIEGSSLVFTTKEIFTVYPIPGHLDNCNFGYTTVWEGGIYEV